MARPIKEKPIFTGKDAERFVERAERVENMSEEDWALIGGVATLVNCFLKKMQISLTNCGIC